MDTVVIKDKKISTTGDTEKLDIDNGVLDSDDGSEKYVAFIPLSVTKIGAGEFKDCKGLMAVSMLHNVTEIGPNAFEGCKSLTDIEIPNGVTKICEGTFRGCTSLIYVKIPNSVKEIGEGAFSDCPNITVYCSEGSYAEQYCIDNDIKYNTKLSY